MGIGVKRIRRTFRFRNNTVVMATFTRQKDGGYVVATNHQGLATQGKDMIKAGWMLRDAMEGFFWTPHSSSTASNASSVILTINTKRLKKATK